jgi:ABC-type Fe2+-enterobactin transport system substrate-binding protein
MKSEVDQEATLVKMEDEEKPDLVLVSALQRDSAFIARAVLTQMSRTHPGVPVSCTWCGATAQQVTIYRCQEQECFERLHACGPCIVIAHQQRPWHMLEVRLYSFVSNSSH